MYFCRRCLAVFSQSLYINPLLDLTMVNRVLQPQEIEVFYVIPALRRELAVCMKASGRSQKLIAKLLGVTEAAVSQYFSSKRAAAIKFDDRMKSVIREAAGRINDEISMFNEMQQLLKVSRQERVVCQAHASLGCPKSCNACFEGK